MLVLVVPKILADEAVRLQFCCYFWWWWRRIYYVVVIVIMYHTLELLILFLMNINTVCN